MKVIQILFKSQQHNAFQIAGTFRLMLFREINAIYSENKSTNMLEKSQETYTAEDIIHFQRQCQ